MCYKKTNFHKTTIFLYAIFFCVLAACSESKPIEENRVDQVIKKQYTPEKNEVTIKLLKNETFKDEILSNGHLIATQKSVLKFEVAGTLEALMIKEGDRIPTGQIIAQLDPYKYQEALKDAEISLSKALLELEDMLVGRGYDIKKKNEIPKQVYKMVTLRSGYSEALQSVKKATYNIEATKLRAPFAGKAASVNYKVHDQINAGTIFLTLIDDAFFDVEFYVTESEVHKVVLNQLVTVVAIGSQKKYQGKIVSINPLVEKNGTVLVKSRIKNDSQLMEGMKVMIQIEKSIPNQFIVPKSAIVLRQNQEVLFKVVNGRAYWTYVQTVYENKNYYTVIPNPEKSSATLNVGDSIITTGNLNLAHDSEVVIQNKSSRIKN